MNGGVEDDNDTQMSCQPARAQPSSVGTWNTAGQQVSIYWTDTLGEGYSRSGGKNGMSETLLCVAFDTPLCFAMDDELTPLCRQNSRREDPGIYAVVSHVARKQGLEEQRPATVNRTKRKRSK